MDNDEIKFVDLLIVKHAGNKYVVEVESGQANVGDLVEFSAIPGETMLGEVINNGMCVEVGGERYLWIAELLPIHTAVQIWEPKMPF